MLRNVILCAAAILIALAAALPALAQGQPTGQAISNLNVRSGPGETYPVLAVLPRRSIVIIEGRNSVGNWVRVHTADEATRGWVATRYLIMQAELISLPVVEESAAAANPAAPSGPVDLSGVGTAPAGPFAVDVNTDALIARMSATPVLPGGVSARVRAIFALGQQLGRRPNTFSKLGDCMTTFHAFLVPFGVGEYDLGPYADLQAVIDFYSVSPRPEVGVANSFVNDSMASWGGFSAASVLDPQWANPAHCRAGESPLDCEYRLVQPAVAIIMFGAIDMQYLRADQFGPALRSVVRATIERGVIPLLSTFPSSPDYLWQNSLELNAAIVQIAEEEQIPLINFWLATRSLPAYGLADDHYHLSFSGDRFISFNGDQDRWGYTLRNLLTLQALDLLRREVLAGG